MIDQLQWSASRVLHLLDHVPCEDVLVIQRALYIIDSCVWHATAFKCIEPLFRRLGFEFVFDDAVERVAVLDSKGVGDEARIRLPFGLGDFVAENAIQFVIAAADGNVGVFGLVGSVRYDGSCSYVSTGL